MATHNWQFGRNPDDRRSPLGHARGYGAAGHGTHQWLVHRLTSVALVPLVPWFLYSLLSGVATDVDTMRIWLGHPGNMTLMILFIICAFWHGQLAYSVVAHDYVHGKAINFAVLAAIAFGCTVLAVFAIVSVIKIGLGG